MKVERQANEMTPSHKGVVFANEQTARQKDMTQVIGRFDEPNESIVFINDNALGTKYKALMNSGMALHLAKDDRNNYYVTDLLDNIAKTGMHEATEIDDYKQQKNDVEQEHEREERPLIYKTEQEFIEQDIDSAMDLDFTTEDLKFEHRVGLYNEDANSYTLREDVEDLLDEFEFDVDEQDDGVVARIANESVNARKLIQLIRLLKQQEQEDEEELKEAIESDRVQVNALSKVKSLLKQLRLAQRHGDIEESEEAELELNELLDSYRDANPPAKGIDKVEKERDDILTKSESFNSFQERNKPKQSTTSRAGKAVKRGAKKAGRAVKRSAKKGAKKASKAGKSYASNALKQSYDNQMRSAESLDERMKRQADTARATMQILEAQGIQVRGQVFNG